MKKIFLCLLSSIVINLTAFAQETNWVEIFTVEAENFQLVDPIVVENHYIVTSSSNAGEARYSFTLQESGEYRMDCLVDAPHGGADSFFVNVDNLPTDPFMIWDILPNTDGWEEKSIGWRGDGTFDEPALHPKIFELDAGSHELIITGRESGTRLDKLTLLKKEISSEEEYTGLKIIIWIP